MEWVYGILGIAVIGAFCWSWSKMPDILKEWTNKSEKNNFIRRIHK
ncbi:hypothetical protein IGI65_002789 [Enterococcus sp. DIV0755b]